jgi:predicted TIM-barrel fold metal-dependent hydrolase
MKPTNTSELLQACSEWGAAADCPIVDVHAHYGPYRAIYFPHRGEAEAMLSVMDRVGVRIAVLSGHTALADARLGNQEIAEVVAAHPDRFRGYIVINPHYPEYTAAVIDQFDTWMAEGFVGFKLHPGMHEYPLTGPNYASLLEFANARRVPILCHTWGADGTCGTVQVRAIVERYSDLPFIAGHACYGDWDPAIALARKHENLFLELTAAYAVNGILERMVEGAGAGNVLFGNDLPWFDTAYALGCVLYAHITDAERHAILHRNAERLLHI